MIRLLLLLSRLVNKEAVSMSRRRAGESAKHVATSALSSAVSAASAKQKNM
jgi:hypothetical protein